MTTTELLPAIEVPSSPVTPAPFGLLSLPPSATPSDAAWQAGVWWRTDGAAVAGITYGVCTVDDDVPGLDATLTCEYTSGIAFTVYARSTLSLGSADPDVLFADARRQLAAAEQYAVETALWARFVAATPDATATAEDPVAGLALAEGLAAGLYRGAPVAHVGRYGASLLHEALYPTGQRLATRLGTTVVAGTGYGQPAPDTQGDPFTLFVTGSLVVLRSEVFDLGMHHDYPINSTAAVVERTYVIGWDSPLVEVTVTPPAAA